jgi:hypothetical protein
MQTMNVEGQEYRLVPIKKEEKTIFAFTLSMPNAGSWNSRWTGSNRCYVITRTAYRRKKEVYPACKEGSYFYDFGDGWGASIKVELVTPKEARKLERKSNGFCGYDWMVECILNEGKITKRR